MRTDLALKGGDFIENKLIDLISEILLAMGGIYESAVWTDVFDGIEAFDVLNTVPESIYDCFNVIKYIPAESVRYTEVYNDYADNAQLRSIRAYNTNIIQSNSVGNEYNDFERPNDIYSVYDIHNINSQADSYDNFYANAVRELISGIDKSTVQSGNVYKPDDSDYSFGAVADVCNTTAESINMLYNDSYDILYGEKRYLDTDNRKIFDSMNNKSFYFVSSNYFEAIGKKSNKSIEYFNAVNSNYIYGKRYSDLISHKFFNVMGENSNKSTGYFNTVNNDYIYGKRYSDLISNVFFKAMEDKNLNKSIGYFNIGDSDYIYGGRYFDFVGSLYGGGRYYDNASSDYPLNTEALSNTAVSQFKLSGDSVAESSSRLYSAAVQGFAENGAMQVNKIKAGNSDLFEIGRYDDFKARDIESIYRSERISDKNENSGANISSISPNISIQLGDIYNAADIQGIINSIADAVTDAVVTSAGCI